MRMVVVVRQVLEAEEPVRTTQGRVETAGCKLVLDTMDEYAVEAALRLREQGNDAEIVAVAVGNARTDEALRSALAMGADRAVLVESELWLDALTTSAIVAEIVRREEATLLLTGGQQADWDSQALGAGAAAHLDWPQITWATELSMTNGKLRGRHDVEDGAETFSVMIPCVVTAQQGLNEPRYPTLPNILKARNKPLQRIPVEEFAVAAKVSLEGVAVLAMERRHRIIDGKDVAAAAAELVDLLRNEAKVLA